MVVVAKPGLDELVELDDLLVEGHHLLRQGVHQLRGQSFPGKAGELAFGGLDGCLGELVGVADAAVAEPGLQALGTEATQCGRSLVAGQQGERAGVGEVQGPLQSGEDAGELGAEPVDGAGAVGDEVHAAASEDLEVSDGFVADAYGVQVPSDPDLVGDDCGVLGVGLALASVTLGSAVDGSAGDVVHGLVVVEEDRDGQGGSAVGQVDAPGHLIAHGQDVDE
ncbi:hypothetical protein QFZ22_000013 [Streptomyces canus]|uniref:Uncharacterized protein n=1 Tax=Streptomyces canus TaxID=58343 RepID=A0AAW8F5F7_9ACTN|nr:hypothetical protein [Streptomyces canus]